jgi:NTE family protein
MDISLALGGGGAKGNSHIGVLRCLVKEGFRVRAVAGTSFGGVVAVMYAAGYSPDEIEENFKRVNQKRLYTRDAFDGPSLLGVAGVRKWLDESLGTRTFNDLKLPCAVTSVDLKSGREVILSEGPVKDAILATIALPGIFPSQHLDDWELVDGGVLDPVPVSVARSLAPNVPVVAVVLSDPLGSPVHTWSVPIPAFFPQPIVDRITRLSFAQAYDTFMRSIEIGNRAVTEYRLDVDKPEVVIRPAVTNIKLLESVNVSDVARLGEEAVEAVLPVLRLEVKRRRSLGWMLFGGRK